MANKPAKAAPVVTKKKHTVKTKGVRVRAMQDVKLFYSDKHTPPFNDVIRVDKGEAIVVQGITEEQKIAEGSRYPHVQKVSFQKTSKERKKWKEVHTNQKMTTSGGMPRKSNELKSTLIVHYINHGRKQDFVSTRSFKEVAPSEVHSVIKVAVKLRNDADTVLNHVSKYYYAGKRWIVKNGKADQY